MKTERKNCRATKREPQKGRPPLREGVSRTDLVSVRVSAAERATLDKNAAAAGLCRSVFILESLRRSGALD